MMESKWILISLNKRPENSTIHLMLLLNELHMKNSVRKRSKYIQMNKRILTQKNSRQFAEEENLSFRSHIRI